MQFVILGLLLIEPLSLYDVRKRFTAGPSLFYSASFGSIQRALQKMESDGWVRVDADPESPRGRKVYAITAEGESAWRDWMVEPVSGAHAETTMLARVFLLGLLPGDERDAALAVLRDAAGTELDQLRGVARALDAQPVPAEYADVFRYQRATLDYGIRSNELALRWLDELE